MSSETRDLILSTAQQMVQAHGYGGLSFRDLAKAVGIKSASVHYHFPTKGDLGAALARLYTEKARDDLEQLLAEESTAGGRLRRYTALFRAALEKDNRMCLCGIMAAEFNGLPEIVRVEVRGFADLNTDWLAAVLDSQRERAQSIFAAVTGAQLVARGLADIAAFDAMIEAYRVSGLIPG